MGYNVILFNSENEWENIKTSKEKHPKDKTVFSCFIAHLGTIQIDNITKDPQKGHNDNFYNYTREMYLRSSSEILSLKSAKWISEKKTRISKDGKAFKVAMNVIKKINLQQSISAKHSCQ